MKTARLLLLSFVLFWAQSAIAGHGIEHAFHEHEDACVECLALPGFAAVPVRPPHLPMPRGQHSGEPVAVLPAPTFASRPAFRSRAPPRFRND
jgi:hypothetical protein